ncbi:RNA-binding protein 6 isoform X2 [Kryptolebias marmoratus]|uniref:RNA-binding protein 6 isoform X2 n=1 Tax=Kryptolebias marmoratus TaxID=37003 RepID=UPI0007F878DD|nr:RNA-binding protein 6 isoform X2 [Kryptolebias marmoratus]
MWEGPGPGRGPWGGPHFRGDQRGEMFGGHDHPMPCFRGRDGMNMGPMGQMGPRHQGLHPMDRRRMDGPPMRGPMHMDPREMLGRDSNQEFFRPGEEADFRFRRHVEVSIREKIMNASDFPGPGRGLGDMGSRDMPPWDSNKRFFDTRDRESIHHDMPRFNRPNFDDRRGFPMDRMEPNDGFGEMRDRYPMGVHDAGRYDKDCPPHEKRGIDIDRRGQPPFNPRNRFDSDVDFRNQPGPPVEFKGRDRSPLRFGRSNDPPVDRERSDMPSNVGPRQSEFMDSKDSVGNRQYPSGTSVMDYRSGEEMTLAEEWKNRHKDKNPFLDKNMGVVPEPNFPVGFVSDVNLRDSLSFNDRNKPPVGFQGEDGSFTSSDHFLAKDLPTIGSKSPQHHPLPEIKPLPIQLDRENKKWLEEKDPKYIFNKPNCDERPPYLQGKNEPSCGSQDPSDSFKEMKNISRDQVPSIDDFGNEQNFQTGSTLQAKDQDYRDIDYRTGSAVLFDYKHKEFPQAEELLKDSKSITPSAFTDSGSQDQDYRNASVKNKVSNIISISGIPKTTTVDQILGSFAVRDGVPMQGIKIQDVVPGYSYDMAYVEFLNLKDAVHFMESNKGFLKLGTRMACMKYVQPDECKRDVYESDHQVPQPQDSQLHRSDEPSEVPNGSNPNHPMEQLSHGRWQRSSDLTPEAWQQQVDQQLQEEEEETEQQGDSLNNNHGLQNSKSVFSESKTMIIKNLRRITTVETILKALDPFAYLDERNVRLVKAKPPGTKCFCFVDMDSHEQVTRLVELLTEPKPLFIDGVRVQVEVARPLKNPNLKKDYDKSNAIIPEHPSEPGVMLLQPYPQPLQYVPHLMPPTVAPPAMMVAMPGDLLTVHPAVSSDPSLSQGIGCGEAPAAAPVAAPGYQPDEVPVPTDSSDMAATTDGSQTCGYGSEIPDTSKYLYDSTSGFFYDPETTLYYDPNSRYFYNSQTQEYLYWDATSKAFIPVPGGNSPETHQTTMTPEDQAILSNPAADAPLEMKRPSKPPQPFAAAPAAVSGCGSAESVPAATVALDSKDEDESPKKDKEKDGKDDRPKSLAAVKIMKDMERWAKIQNRQKESVRAPSPILKTEMDIERRPSKSADAAFAIFERKISGGDGLFKKPLTPVIKEEKSKSSMGSLGLLASDYGAGSDEEVEEDKEEAAKNSQKRQPEEKEDKLTDWKKMACLLCRRQFPNKDALIRHQQLSDLHKQNMEIHLKIKRSKKELEALENQEKELNSKGASRSPEQKRRKHHHQQSHHQNNWAGSSRDNKVSERPGLGSEPVQKKKEHVAWDHKTYKEAVRKAMFARYKELE